MQMPKGIPVATFAIGEARAANAALFAVAMLALDDAELAARWQKFRQNQSDKVLAMKLPRYDAAAAEAAPAPAASSAFPLLSCRFAIHRPCARNHPPPATLGMLGGGQLGRFFVAAAHEMGYQVWVLDPTPTAPPARSPTATCRPPTADFAALDTLAEGCAAVTTEFENVPADTLDYLAKFVPVRPRPRPWRCARTASTRRPFSRSTDCPGPFAAIGSEDDLREVDAGLSRHPQGRPLRLRRQGQAVVGDRDEAWPPLPISRRTLRPGKKLALDYEVSVVLARDEGGTVCCFPPARTARPGHPRRLLRSCRAPGSDPPRRRGHRRPHCRKTRLRRHHGR